jgi:hypothetical protein
VPFTELIVCIQASLSASPESWFMASSRFTVFRNFFDERPEGLLLQDDEFLRLYFW